MSVNEDVRTILAAAVELQDLWQNERMLAAYSPTGDGTRSSNVSADPTGLRATTDGKWSDAERIADAIASAAATLARARDRFAPHEAGTDCKTRDCRGTATHSGYCWNCFHWLRGNQHLVDDEGRQVTPDRFKYDETDDAGEPTGRKRRLVDDFNDRLKRECGCLGWACDDHSGETGDRCRREPQSGRGKCDACRKREELARKAAREEAS